MKRKRGKRAVAHKISQPYTTDREMISDNPQALNFSEESLSTFLERLKR